MVKLVGKRGADTPPAKAETIPKRTDKIKIKEQSEEENASGICSMCNNEFPMARLRKYYGKLYCDTCYRIKRAEMQKKHEKKRSKTSLTDAGIIGDIEAVNTGPAVLHNLDMRSPTQIPSFPEIERKFISWLEQLSIADYKLQEAVLKRIQEHNRPAFIKQVVELFWEFLKKEKIVP